MPSLFLSAATATRSTERTFLPKLGAPTIQVSQISCVLWFVKPVRLKRLARFLAFFEAFFPLAAAVAVAATTAASATRKRRVSSVRLCTGISFCWMALLGTKDTASRRVFPESSTRLQCGAPDGGPRVLAGHALGD